MSEGATYYPISQLLRRLVEQFGPSRSEFVQTLGYRYIERGRRRLDPWLDQGQGYNRILKQIATAYPAHADELNEAVAATKVIQAEEAKAAFLERCKGEHATFVPFIFAEGDTRPGSFTVFGLTGGHRRWHVVQVPNAVLEMPLEQQLAELPTLMIAYRQQHNGACPLFGRLTGFKFVRLTDYFQFAADGRLLEHVQKPFRYGEYWVELRGRPFSFHP